MERLLRLGVRKRSLLMGCSGLRWGFAQVNGQPTKMKLFGCVLPAKSYVQTVFLPPESLFVNNVMHFFPEKFILMSYKGIPYGVEEAVKTRKWVVEDEAQIWKMIPNGIKVEKEGDEDQFKVYMEGDPLQQSPVNVQINQVGSGQRKEFHSVQVEGQKSIQMKETESVEQSETKSVQSKEASQPSPDLKRVLNLEAEEREESHIQQLMKVQETGSQVVQKQEKQDWTQLINRRAACYATQVIDNVFILRRLYEVDLLSAKRVIIERNTFEVEVERVNDMITQEAPPAQQRFKKLQLSFSSCFQEIMRRTLQAFNGNTQQDILRMKEENQKERTFLRTPESVQLARTLRGGSAFLLKSVHSTILSFHGRDVQIRVHENMRMNPNNDMMRENKEYLVEMLGEGFNKKSSVY